MGQFECAIALGALSLLSLSGCTSSAIIYETPLRPTLDPGFACGTDVKPSAQSYRDSAKAKALSRCAFVAPESCNAGVKYHERVRLISDISREGVPKNIRIIETTNECLNEAAANTLSRWRYETLAEPETGAEILFNIYRHSNLYQFDRAIRDMSTSD